MPNNSFEATAPPPLNSSARPGPVEELTIVAVVIIGFVAVGIVVYALVKAYEIDQLRRKGVLGEYTASAPNALNALSMLDGLKASQEKSRQKADLDLRDARYRTLERLKSLHDQGVVSDDEYER